jgi:hypothetical protein
MPVKRKNDFQNENSERMQKMNILTKNFEKIAVEHKTLKAKLIQEREKGNPKWNYCEKSSENGNNLKKKKMNDNRSAFSLLKLEQCTKVCNEEWKLNAHN